MSQSLTVHERNCHLTKQEFLALKWVIAEQFQEYLLWKPFIVKTDNNLLTYIMTTHNLDTTWHHCVGSLAGFTFSIKYQKGQDNAAADALSWVTLRLDADTMKSILDGRNAGSTGRADALNPVVADTDEEIHKQVQEAAVQAKATHTCVNLYVTNWVASQWEDPVLKAIINWIPNKNVQDLKHLFGNDANNEEVMAVLQEQKKLMLYQGALYHCHTLASKVGEVMQFVVHMVHRVAAMNRCHRDAGHQGQQWMLYLLQDWFYWASMAKQMQKAISNCKWSIQHEGTHAKAPLQPIIATTPLELLHIDSMSIEMTMELNLQPNVLIVLVFCNHFMKHIMAYVTPHQTAKTVAKFLWQGYISIFEAPAKFLSDWGANFESNITKELCELIGIQKVRTSPYHTQTNWQVVQGHQMLMCMIGKLNKDWKVDWPKHLPELVHAYNCKRSAITGYSPHYLMLRHWLHLPINFYFPMIRGMEEHWYVNYYIAKLHEWLWEAFKEMQLQFMSGAEREKQYCDRKANAISLEPGNLVLAKANAYKRKR